MGGGECHRADQRSGSETRAGGPAPAVSLPHSGVSFRQRQGVHQPHRGRVAPQTVDRADQVPAAALQCQRLGGVQKWSGHPQAHRLRVHRRGTRSRHAVFLPAILQPYLNFHRPCGVPERVINAKGKEQKRYRWYATPWEILRQLPGVAGYLKGDLTIQEMEGWARRQTDMQAATAMQAAKRKLFASFLERRTA